MIIPDNFTDFLFWFKEVTEASWTKKEMHEEDSFIFPNAKWLGMDESLIDDVENKFQLKFPPDHREFLKILHTTNFPPSQNGHFFFNWLKDEKIILEKLNWPYYSISQDKNFLKYWKDVSDSQEIIDNRFNKWYQSAPKLIPVFGHRYLVSEPFKKR